MPDDIAETSEPRVAPESEPTAEIRSPGVGGDPTAVGPASGGSPPPSRSPEARRSARVKARAGTGGRMNRDRAISAVGAAALQGLIGWALLSGLAMSFGQAPDEALEKAQDPNIMREKFLQLGMKLREI